MERLVRDKKAYEGHFGRTGFVTVTASARKHKNVDIRVSFQVYIYMMVQSPHDGT